MKPTTIEDMVDAGRLVTQAPDRLALAQVIGSAERDVLAADANLATFSPWADAMLYEAGLRAARVISRPPGIASTPALAHMSPRSTRRML